MITFGTRIWKRRKDLDLSREEVAGIVKTSPQTLWKWEKDITAPDANEIPKLAKALKCSVASLFGETLLGDDLNPKAILEAIAVLREKGLISLEEVVQAGLTPEKAGKRKR